MRAETPIPSDLHPSLEQQEAAFDAHAAIDEVGSVALQGEAIAEPTRPIQLGSGTYETNLPDGVEALVNKESRFLQQPINPAALDQLPVGDYFVRGTIDGEDEFGDPVSRPVERNLHISSTELGPVIDCASLTENFTINPGVSRLMNALGFVTETTNEVDRISAVPTPATVKHAAGELGVTIQFFEDNDGYIDGEDYLQAYVDETYPVSLGSELHYRHDIEDDHLTAMVLGGEPLKQVLKEVSSRALAQGRDAIDATASDIDAFTAILRAVIVPHHELIGEAFGEEKGRDTLVARGETIGITADDVDKILRNAMDVATKFTINRT